MEEVVQVLGWIEAEGKVHRQETERPRQHLARGPVG